jgi:endonuclease-3 related protein
VNPYLQIYETLYDFYGPQNWWPADTAMEMVVGAVLTQNTSWRNVEKGMAVLRERGVLSVDALSSLSHEELASLIHSTGYYNLKAKRLKNLLHMLVCDYEGDLEYFLEDKLFSSRDKLLQVKGIGEETADAILLYAGQHLIFVVDAYTHRIFSRHNFLEEECSYGDIQEIFMDNLPADVSLYNEYHALIVRLAKDYCKKTNPLCDTCPLKGID